MTTRKHHFVSQFYLRNFSTGTDDKAGLDAYDRETGKTFPVKVKDAAAKRDFNRLDVDGIDNNALEKKLGEIETECAPQFDKLIKEKTFDVHSRDALTVFISLMFLNGQQTRGAIHDLLDKMGQLQTDMFFDQKNLHEKLEVTPEEADKVRTAYKNGAFKLEPNKNYLLNIQFSQLETVRKGVEKRKWAFLSSSKSNQFVTCDNPVCLQWLESGYEKFGSTTPVPSIFAPESVLVFPLSSDVLLLGQLESDFEEGQNMEANDEQVAELNGLIAKNSIRHFYARSKNFTIKCKGDRLVKAKDLQEYFKK